jgi:outer membrane protein assembly factor BamB
VKYATAVCIVIFLGLILISAASAQLSGTGSVPKPTLLWNYNASFPQNADNSSAQWSSPTVAEGVVYVGAISAINFGLPLPIPNQPPYNPDNVWIDFYAFNASTGDTIWDRHSSADNGFVGSSAVSEGKVFLSQVSHADFDPPYTNEKAVLTALNASNGELVWNYTLGKDISAPVVSNGIVFVNSNSTIHALNETNGKEIWQTYGYSGTLPVVHNGILYVGSFAYAQTKDGFFPNYNINALDAFNGRLHWNYSTGFWVSTPAVSNGAVYFCAGTEILALNSLSGAKLWNYSTPHTPRTDGIGDTMTYESSSPTVTHGIVYVFSVRAGTLLALKASDGAQLWNFSRGIGGSTDVGGHPTVVDGYVYVNPGVFAVLNALSGQKVWEYPLNYSGFPVIDNNTAYYSDKNGLYASKLPYFSSAQHSSNIILAYDDKGQAINLSVGGNISSSQISNSYITVDEATVETSIYLTTTGKSGTAGFCNITIPRNVVSYGKIPAVYIDEQKVESQGYTQDTDNYYVWFTMHFSQCEVTITFKETSFTQNEAFGPLQITIVGASIAVAVLAITFYAFVYKKSKR